jgi:hypothetical protein
MRSSSKPSPVASTLELIRLVGRAVCGVQPQERNEGHEAAQNAASGAMFEDTMITSGSHQLGLAAPGSAYERAPVDAWPHRPRRTESSRTTASLGSASLDTVVHTPAVHVPRWLILTHNDS